MHIRGLWFVASLAVLFVIGCSGQPGTKDCQEAMDSVSLAAKARLDSSGKVIDSLQMANSNLVSQITSLKDSVLELKSQLGQRTNPALENGKPEFIRIPRTK
jgi:hypothetical protein